MPPIAVLLRLFHLLRTSTAEIRKTAEKYGTEAKIYNKWKKAAIRERFQRCMFWICNEEKWRRNFGVI